MDKKGNDLLGGLFFNWNTAPNKILEGSWFKINSEFDSNKGKCNDILDNKYKNSINEVILMIEKDFDNALQKIKDNKDRDLTIKRFIKFSENNKRLILIYGDMPKSIDELIAEKAKLLESYNDIEK